MNMELTTFNEEFNELWEESLSKDHGDTALKHRINALIMNAKERDSLVFLGDSHPYEPHKIIPISYDGEKEYITMHNTKLLLYRDPGVEYVEGKIELSRRRVIVWTATVAKWLMSGTEDQNDFIRKHGVDILGEGSQLDSIN